MKEPIYHFLFLIDWFTSDYIFTLSETILQITMSMSMSSCKAPCLQGLSGTGTFKHWMFQSHESFTYFHPKFYKRLAHQDIQFQAKRNIYKRKCPKKGSMKTLYFSTIMIQRELSPRQNSFRQAQTMSCHILN